MVPRAQAEGVALNGRPGVIKIPANEARRQSSFCVGRALDAALRVRRNRVSFVQQYARAAARRAKRCAPPRVTDFRRGCSVVTDGSSILPDSFSRRRPDLKFPRALRSLSCPSSARPRPPRPTSFPRRYHAHLCAAAEQRVRPDLVFAWHRGNSVSGFTLVRLWSPGKFWHREPSSRATSSSRRLFATRPRSAATGRNLHRRPPLVFSYLRERDSDDGHQ